MNSILFGSYALLTNPPVLVKSTKERTQSQEDVDFALGLLQIAALLIIHGVLLSWRS